MNQTIRGIAISYEEKGEGEYEFASVEI